MPVTGATLDEKIKIRLVPDTETRVTIKPGRPAFVADDRGRALAERGQTIYAEIDRTGYYRGHAAKNARSRMNVTFRMVDDALTMPFVQAAASAGLKGLKGHRVVGGIRASIYNAMPRAGVEALVAFMREFERSHG